jgi:hypothetical protein
MVTSLGLRTFLGQVSAKTTRAYAGGVEMRGRYLCRLVARQRRLKTCLGPRSIPQEIPPDRGGYTLGRDELVVEDVDYDQALTAAQRRVPEG